MRDLVVIEGGGGTLAITGEGEGRYRFRLEAKDLVASVRFEDEGESVSLLGEFFETASGSASDDWIEWASPSSEVVLSARQERAAEVTLRISLRTFESEWTADHVLALKPGSLAKIAAEVRALLRPFPDA